MKRQNCATGLLLVALEGRLGVALTSGGDPFEEVGSGSKEKSSSHSNPAPEYRKKERLGSSERQKTVGMCYIWTIRNITVQ